MGIRERITLVIIFLIVAFGSQAQPIDFEESNWHKEIGRYDDWYSRFDLTRYTKEDVEKAKAKFLRIASEKSNDEWSGSYRRQTMLGSAEITWHPNSGYVYAYVYHTLAALGYGQVKSTGDSVSLVSERADYKNHSFESELIRVKLGERQLLVPKERMKEFAIWVVGRGGTKRSARERNLHRGWLLLGKD